MQWFIIMSPSNYPTDPYSSFRSMLDLNVSTYNCGRGNTVVKLVLGTIWHLIDLGNHQ